MKLKIALIASIVFIVQAVVFAAPMKVTVDKVKGKVEARANDTAGWKTVANGTSVAVGSTVRTGAGASCMLKWAGGNVVKVDAMSQLKVSQADKGANGAENSTVDLSSGKVSARAKKFNTPDSSFKVKTPTAVAGVRGTYVVGEVDESGESHFGVVEGSVAVEAGGQEIILDEGFMLDYSEINGFTEPEVIPPDELEVLQQEAEEVTTEAQQDEAAGEAATEETPVKPQTTEEAKDEAEAASTAVDDVIDTALDEQIINDIVNQSSEDYVTGDVQVTIDFNGGIN
jgi:hypothetical protein